MSWCGGIYLLYIMLYVELRNNSTVYEELPVSIEDLTVENVVLLVIFVLIQDKIFLGNGLKLQT